MALTYIPVEVERRKQVILKFKKIKRNIISIIMIKIQPGSTSNSVKVLYPTFVYKGNSITVYLDKSILDFLRNKGLLDKLNTLELRISFTHKNWEISENPPLKEMSEVGTVSPTVFSKKGSLVEDGTNQVTCRLS
ncbi:MAG TPA: hypothetical protein V6D43_22185 [Candidatus Sericytochromatia bacterium]|jgi:hypothetical protein